MYFFEIIFYVIQLCATQKWNVISRLFFTHVAFFSLASHYSAQFAGLLCEEQGSDADNVKYCGYCKYHHSKLVSVFLYYGHLLMMACSFNTLTHTTLNSSQLKMICSPNFLLHIWG